MSKLIMSHMSKEPFNLSFWPLITLSLTLVNSYVHLVPAFPLAIAANGVLLAGYLHYVYVVVSEICGYLNIRCFKIPVLPEEKRK